MRREVTGASPNDAGAASDAPFTEPWHAQLHAVTIALHETGAFAWNEWAAALSARLHEADAALDGSDYWYRWLDALVELLDTKGLAEATTVREIAAAWQRAAKATPHGVAIDLANDPLR